MDGGGPTPTARGETAVTVAEFGARMGDYLALVRGGARLLLTEAGQPVAQVAAPPTPSPHPGHMPWGALGRPARVASDFDETPADLIAIIEGDDAPGPPTRSPGLPFGAMAGRIRVAPDFAETPADLVAAMEGDGEAVGPTPAPPLSPRAGG